MAQVDVRLSRKPYSRGESTEARIIREIQIASLCTCNVGEITAKLVSRTRLVTPHMARATNMRMIICFMIILSLSDPLAAPRAADLRPTHPAFPKKEYSFSSCFIPRGLVVAEKRWNLGCCRMGSSYCASCTSRANSCNSTPFRSDMAQ
jgi:hypothetical protein